MPTLSPSFASQLGIHTADPVTKSFSFLTADLSMNEALIDPNGISGTRSRHGELVREGLQRIGGLIEMNPTAVELALLLPWILGTNASGTTYALAETLQTRFVVIDRVAKVFTYTGVGIDSCTFSAAQGEPLKVAMQTVGISETVGAAGSFPSLSVDITTQAFILSDLALTIGGTTVYPKSFEITINNSIDKDRFFNSNTLNAILANDRQTTFRTSLPYDSDMAAIYDTGGDGAAIVATFTNGATSCVFTLANAFFPRRTPQVPNRQEIMLSIEATAYMTSTTKELVVTLDSTP